MTLLPNGRTGHWRYPVLIFAKSFLIIWFFFFFKRGLFATTCYTLRCVDWKGDLLPHFDVFLTSPAGFGIRTYCFVFLGNNGVHPLHFISAPDSRLLRDEWVGAWDKAQKKFGKRKSAWEQWFIRTRRSRDRCCGYVAVIDGWSCHIFHFLMSADARVLSWHDKVYMQLCAAPVFHFLHKWWQLLSWKITLNSTPTVVP